MKFSLDKRDNFCILKVEESKVLSIHAPKLKSQLTLLNIEGYKNVILDLEEVTYVDSSGLSAILVGNRLCKDSSGTFVISNASNNVVKLIKISQLDSILNIIPSINESIEFLMLDELEREHKA